MNHASYEAPNGKGKQSVPATGISDKAAQLSGRNTSFSFRAPHVRSDIVCGLYI